MTSHPPTEAARSQPGAAPSQPGAAHPQASAARSPVDAAHPQASAGHPQTDAALAAQPDEALSVDNLEAVRASMREAIDVEVGRPGVKVPVIEDVDADGTPCRLYDPSDGAGAPVAVYLHGGGWVMGDLDTHDGLCRRLAASSGCAVLAVAYRLAPEHPWPAAVEDVDTAVAWLRAHAVDHGLDASRLAITGDSSGGHLAAVAALRARDAGQGFACQVLVYPVIDPAMASESYRTCVGAGLDLAQMRFFWDAFAPPGLDRTHPDLAPAHADLAGLPPTLLITAERDPLRDEGEAYGAALAEAGVPTVVTRYQGVNHGFARKLALFDAAPAAVNHMAATLRAALADAVA